MPVHSEEQFLIELEGAHNDAGYATDDAEDVEAARPVEPTRVANRYLTAVAVFALVGLASLVFASASSNSVNTSGNRFRGLQDEDAQAKHTRELTAEYARARIVNDIPTIQALYASNSTVHLNLSGLAWQPARGIKLIIPLELKGPAEIAKYYEAFRIESEDVGPEPTKFKCTADTCITHESMVRGLYTINTDAVLTWSGEDKVQSLELKLSSPDGDDVESWQKRLAAKSKGSASPGSRYLVDSNVKVSTPSPRPTLAPYSWDDEKQERDWKEWDAVIRARSGAR